MAVWKLEELYDEYVEMCERNNTTPKKMCDWWNEYKMRKGVC